MTETKEFYGGFWIRFGAILVDSLIMWGITIGINHLLGVSPPAQGQQINSDSLFALLFSIIASFLYYAFLQGFLKGSPGKHLFGLTLLDESTLEKLSIGQMVGRYLMSFISSICFGIGYLSVVWNPKRKGWHDRAAGTVVVKKKYLNQLQS